MRELEGGHRLPWSGWPPGRRTQAGAGKMREAQGDQTRVEEKLFPLAGVVPRPWVGLMRDKGPGFHIQAPPPKSYVTVGASHPLPGPQPSHL